MCREPFFTQKICVEGILKIPCFALGSGARYQILSHVFARCTSQTTRETRVSHAKRVRFSHGRVLFDSRYVQKCVTQIIYLGPLPTWHWFFLCFGFLETWERPGPSGPESDDCELASEPIYTLWADIFTFRYFSSATFDWNIWQKKGIWDAKGRIQAFPRWFRAILNFRIGVGHVVVKIKKLRDWLPVLMFF